MICQIIQGDCIRVLENYRDTKIDLTFLDPPFNQSKEYRNHKDNMAQQEYWSWMRHVSELIFQNSSQGAAIYFMQREKNAKFVLDTLDSSGWTFQNLIIWKKKTSAVPSDNRYGKHYQIIAFGTKGASPRVFNKIRIDPPLLETEKYRRPDGMYVTDVWDDIRELTSGYLAGEEPLRDERGERFHKQQSPVHLLMRIIISSTKVGDLVFDPFAGTGTTLVTSNQLSRNSIGVELDQINVDHIEKRINTFRPSDDLCYLRNYYRFTNNLDTIWPMKINDKKDVQTQNQLELF
jgi:site-specific DNA-methyltransferase (adenine-specific)